MSSRPLEGLKILDFTHVLAGPFGTRVLGDLGADVVKVNSASRGGVNAPESPYYIMWNRNKRALSLDMSNEAGQQIALDLAVKADVVIDNFSVGVLDRWGLGYERVQETNPGVIYVQMSGMGDNGPWSDFVTYAPTIHAVCGLTHLTGVPGREDIGVGYSYNDHQSGLHGTVAVLAALVARRRTGRGQRVDMSQFEVGANFCGPALLDYLANGVAARSCANKLPYDQAAPHNVYRCAPAETESVADERWLAIACMTDEHWRNLRVAMGDPDWAQDTSLKNVEGRIANEALIDQNIAGWLADKDDYEMMDLLQKAGVPAGVVQNGADLQERDPQFELSDYLIELDDPLPVIGPTFADRLPIRFSRTPCNEYTRVRTLGEDNEAVLRDWLGSSDDEIQQATERGALN